MHRWRSGDALTNEDGEPLDDDAIARRVDQAYVFQRSLAWIPYVNSGRGGWKTGKERREDRMQQKAFLARYGYMHMFSWGDISTFKIDEAVHYLHELVKAENAAASKKP